MTNKQLSESIDDIVSSIDIKPDKTYTTWYRTQEKMFSNERVIELMKKAAELGYRLAQKEYKK